MRPLGRGTGDPCPELTSDQEGASITAALMRLAQEKQHVTRHINGSPTRSHSIKVQ